MTINVDFPGLLDLIKADIAAKRTDSASFLIWYLRNYYRLDSLDAVDAVCDQRGDKGVDGLYLDEQTNTLEVFQSKIVQKPGNTVGDTALKEFFGTLAQFDSREALSKLAKETENVQLGSLIKNLNLVELLPTLTIKGVFVSNANIDVNGQTFLDKTPRIEFVGKERLEATYISDERNDPVAKPCTFDITGGHILYTVDKDTECVIAPIRALELVAMDGVSDQSVFALNVRGSLGNTGVNKAIVESIADPAKHKLFPLFHNGLTVICKTLEVKGDQLTVSGYFVVNGCQSLTSLFKNKAKISDELRLLTKFVRLNLTSPLPGLVTKYSNNQNGVRARDFKSNDLIQVRLQNEFGAAYPGEYWYEVKRGEQPGVGSRISNEDAGLMLMAFDLKEPWATHRKYQVFDEKYPEIFARPEVSADRIVALSLLQSEALLALADIKNERFRQYALCKYLLIYLVRRVLDEDQFGQELLRNIRKVRDKDWRSKFQNVVGALAKEIVIDVNGELDGLGEDFDYRGKLRDEAWVKHIAGQIVSAYQKQIKRGRIQGVKELWDK